jgi:hypothetical protein
MMGCEYKWSYKATIPLRPLREHRARLMQDVQKSLEPFFVSLRANTLW